MASELPNSRKQEHLEAGKRRLEEFRKKKAAEKAKKAAPGSQLNNSDAGIREKQPSEAERVQLTHSDGAGTSDIVGIAEIGPSGVTINNEIRATEFVQKNERGSSYDRDASPPFSASNYYIYSADPMPTHANDNEIKGDDAFGPSGLVNYSHQDKGRSDEFGIYTGETGKLADGIATEKVTAPLPPSIQDVDSKSRQYSNGFVESLPNNVPNKGHSELKDVKAVNLSTSHLVRNDSPEGSGTYISGYPEPPAFDPTSSYKVGVTDSYYLGKQSTPDAMESSHYPIPDTGEWKHSGSVGTLISANSRLWPESRSSGFSLDSKSSSSHISPSPTIATTNTRRSRPSFLDSINVAIASTPLREPEKADSFSSKIYPVDVLASPASQNSMNSSVVFGIGGDLFRHGVSENMERQHNFYSRKQDEDFAALEQHIEDLTQEKFSLQRALEASRSLAESLAAENSALTDSYNQQGSVVNQLKSDMEKLHEEIKAQLVELESMKSEYANAKMECQAADERAKLLASEVIGLEDKALRLRSSELKLERQLENSQAEISSFRKKISTLEMDRQDLQSTVNAMQEEKKLLQSKLRKASASGKLVEVSKGPTSTKDMSTSTEDLVSRNDADTTPETSNLEMPTSAHPWQPENEHFSLESLYLNIPSEHMRMIQNINTLISELALEKEELMQLLSAESSEGSKLKELNKELSRKLEVQTQRLELLTSQSMMHNKIPERQQDSHTVNEDTPYADEGDEVVERVLGWIMKLFPGGPSRRRTSKLL